MLYVPSYLGVISSFGRSGIGKMKGKRGRQDTERFYLDRIVRLSGSITSHNGGIASRVQRCNRFGITILLLLPPTKRQKERLYCRQPGPPRRILLPSRRSRISLLLTPVKVDLPPTKPSRSQQTLERSLCEDDLKSSSSAIFCVQV